MPELRSEDEYVLTRAESRFRFRRRNSFWRGLDRAFYMIYTAKSHFVFFVANPSPNLFVYFVCFVVPFYAAKTIPVTFVANPKVVTQSFAEVGQTGVSRDG